MLRVEGRIANEDAEFDGAIEIDTETGLIAKVGPREGRSDLATDGCVIFAGFGDLHVHAREDVSGREMYKEDFASASAAAIHGGVTHFADMPNNPVAPIDDASYAAKEKLTQRRAGAHYAVWRHWAGDEAAGASGAVQGVHGAVGRGAVLFVAGAVGGDDRAVSRMQCELSL